MKRRLKLINILKFAGNFDGHAAFGDIMILQIVISVERKCYLKRDVFVLRTLLGWSGRDRTGRTDRESLDALHKGAGFILWKILLAVVSCDLISNCQRQL